MFQKMCFYAFLKTLRTYTCGQEQSQLHLSGQLPQVRNRVRQPSLLREFSQL